MGVELHLWLAAETFVTKAQRRMIDSLAPQSLFLMFNAFVKGLYFSPDASYTFGLVLPMCSMYANHAPNDLLMPRSLLTQSPPSLLPQVDNHLSRLWSARGGRYHPRSVRAGHELVFTIL